MSFCLLFGLVCVPAKMLVNDCDECAFMCVNDCDDSEKSKKGKTPVID